MSTAAAAHHRPLDDIQALATGSLLAALGIVLFQQAGLVPGGTVGLSLLLSYTSGLPLAVAMVLANAPFYLLAYLRFGPAFTLKTALAVTAAAAFAHLMPQGLQIARVQPLFGAVLGGLLCGVGMLVLFRHRASLGGLNVVALHAQERFGWNAGRVQMGIDAAIVLGGGLWATDLPRVAASVLAVVVLNLVLAVNHRPGRYRVEVR